ncbi:MAG: phosphoribosylglycinamide synthetase C domain-containing protein, partial [Candidatus Dormibacteria bacterium]
IVMPLLADPVPYLLQAAQGVLELPSPSLLKAAAVGVVAAREPYPEPVAPGGPIEGLAEAAQEGCLVFQMGTRRGPAGTVEVAGGRVLICVGTGESVSLARARAYSGIEKIRFLGMRYRSDIAA